MKPLSLAVAVLLSSVALADPPKVTEADAKAKADALNEALKGDDLPAKIAAIAACGEMPHATTAAALAPVLVEGVDDLRSAAAGALGHMKGLADAAKALHAGLQPNDGKAAVLGEIFRAIAAVDHASSVPVVEGWIEKKLKKKETATTPPVDVAIECLGGLTYKKSVDSLITLLKETEAAQPKPAKGAAPPPPDTRLEASLTHLTSQSLRSSAEWTAWWKKNEASYNEDMTPKKK